MLGGGVSGSPLPLQQHSGLEGHKGHSQELRKSWAVPRASILQFSVRSIGPRTGQSRGHKNLCKWVTQYPGPPGIASKASSHIIYIPTSKFYLQSQQDFNRIAKTAILYDFISIFKCKGF